MDKEALKRIFKFLEEKGEHRMPLKFKLLNNIPLTKEELIVDDDLNLSYTNITSLPEGLKVGGSLLLSGCKNITSLPEGLKVGGNLNLIDTNITSLPNGLEVGRDLYLNNSNIKSLPENLVVVGNLDLHNCENLTSLPKRLTVGNWLDLDGTKITSLPEGLEVFGILYICSTKLEKYSDEELREMIKPGFIEGEIIR